MHKDYGSCFVCVFYHIRCYISCNCLYNVIENKVSLSFSWHFLDIHCVDFIVVTLFRSYGNICRSPMPSLLDRLSVIKTDIMSLVCMSRKHMAFVWPRRSTVIAHAIKVQSQRIIKCLCFIFSCFPCCVENRFSIVL